MIVENFVNRYICKALCNAVLSEFVLLLATLYEVATFELH